MSQWTHVNGSIRIDGLEIIPGADEKSIKALMGRMVFYADSQKKWDACTVPCGSEGSLHYVPIKAGSGIVLWTVVIWGDLRDYDNVEEIKEWFTGIVDSLQPGHGRGLFIRSAVLEIAVEYREVVVLVFKPNKDSAGGKVVEMRELPNAKVADSISEVAKDMIKVL